jgi:hypothetical protein
MLQRTLALLRSLPASVSTIAMPTPNGAGTILAGIIGAVALIFTLAFFWAVYIAGLLWVSKNVLDYLNIAAVVAFATCILVLLPCALFRFTRKFSAYGFLISSVFFGLSTWVLAFLVTFQHWGVTGLFVGLFLGGVGVVPIGLMASAFNAAWPQVGDLILGVVLTFGARAIVFLLSQSIYRDQAGICANSPPNYTAPIVRSPILYAKEKWKALARFDRIQSQQVIITALYVLFVGGLAVHDALHPSRSNYDYHQLVANLNAHPVSSVSGALLPAVIFSPLVYWMFGWIFRRNAARFKICEHCAETIKSEAKVCRYCGRDVAPPRQMEVGARQRTEDEQRQLGAHANRVDPVLAASATGVINPTYEAQSRKPRQLSRPGLVTACVLGLVLFGSVGVWIAPHRALVEPSTKIAADPIDEADTAYRKGDYATALRLIRPLADKGNAAAQNLLGSIYSAGKGVPRNDAEAVRWLRLAADQNNVVAQNNLGMAYENGLGVPRNSAEAARWYRLAAERGFVDAQFNLGQMYFAGPVEMQNSVDAVKWFRLAANRGNAAAQYFLGVMYVNGSGVMRDYFNAYIWFSLALAQADSDLRDTAEKFRDWVEANLTPAQLAQAKKFLQLKSTDKANLLSDADFGVIPETLAQKQSGQGGTSSTRR